jgi:hypothetical protein
MARLSGCTTEADRRGHSNCSFAELAQVFCKRKMKTLYANKILVVVCSGLLCLLGCRHDSSSKTTPGVEQAVSDAIDAYTYGYPLVTMDMTRKIMSNVAAPTDSRAPLGQLIRMRTYPAVDDHTFTAPNADTLYTMLWLDVFKEPWVISVPDMGDRYYLMPLVDGWTEVFQSPGKRTTGGRAQKFAIVGPGWAGTLPAGVTEYKSATGLVWMIGRISCSGTPRDYKAVHVLQDKFSAVPLSYYGKPYTPPFGKVDANLDMKKPTRDQVDSMPVNEYFNRLALLMKTNPPVSADAAMLATLARIGIVPGQDFDASKLGVFDKELIKTVPKLAQAKMLEHLLKIPQVNGWLFTTEAGTYGTDYLQRAVIAAIGLGANLPQDSVYPMGRKAGDGDELDASSKKYVLHFDKGELPPVNAFWSLTMYDKDNFFVPNQLNRYTLSSRDKFVGNQDGSVDFYLQADSPGKEKQANWLPAPKAKFVPMLRLYWPRDSSPSIIDGTWKPPAVTVAQ